MGDNARRADVLSGPGHPLRAGLVPKTRRARKGIERAPGSATAPGDLMRLFVAIAPPSAVLDELEHETYHTHTIDRLVFARLSLRGAFRYNPVPDTFVRWHAGNWIKTPAAEGVREIVRSTVWPPKPVPTNR